MDLNKLEIEMASHESRIIYKIETLRPTQISGRYDLWRFLTLLLPRSYQKSSLLSVIQLL